MRILGLILLVASASACSIRVVPHDPEDLIARLVQDIERLERRGFAGQLVVAREEVTLVRRGFGKLAPGGTGQVDSDAVMPLASLTKPITASAVLALVAEGRLGLDDPIGDHLPGLAAHWTSVPVRHFMTHTAGLPAEIVNRSWDGAPAFEPIDRGIFIGRVNAFQPDHAPGAGFNYSNVGYNLLAALIEVITGESYENFVTGSLLATAGVDGIGLKNPG